MVTSVSDSVVVKNYTHKVVQAKAFHKLVCSVIHPNAIANIASVVYSKAKLIVYLSSAAHYLAMNQYIDDILCACAKTGHLPKVDTVVFKLLPMVVAAKNTDKKLPKLPGQLSSSLKKLANSLEHEGLKSSLLNWAAQIKKSRD